MLHCVKLQTQGGVFMRFIVQLCAIFVLLFGLAATAHAGGRISGLEGDALSRAELEAAGVAPMTRAEVEAFIAAHSGKLLGDIGPWHDSLRFYADKTIKGESRGDVGATVATGSGSWSLDEDGTLHLFVNWKFGDKQRSSGKLYAHKGYLYQMDAQDSARSWLYRLKQ
jgi:hypothetical protein